MKNEDGYELWLRYCLIKDQEALQEYRKTVTAILIAGHSPTLQAAGEELQSGLEGLLGLPVPSVTAVTGNEILLAGKWQDIESHIPVKDRIPAEFPDREGYHIFSVSAGENKITVIAADTDIGVLYGAFHFLRLLQTHKPLMKLSVTGNPRIQLRMLDHWDNLDGTIERGYAGFSLWDWQKLPDYLDPRYRDYARANASIGINSIVLNNVNANALSLSAPYLEKTRALADLFRIYGISVFLSARFSAPIELGELTTNDPLAPEVAGWWKTKAAEIYKHIPDFGGFLIKANSEGQPGPQDYGRTHADGANMLAAALAPYGGKVIWRAFVYDFQIQEDRAKQAYTEFTLLDGKFESNALIQVKNGAIDFQPREPFHPLFGAMPSTPLILEFQITQEYLGCATHLAYLAPLFKECLDSDTMVQGQGSTVDRVVDGSLHNNRITGIAGIANTGSDRNWCGHPFAQANWYAFGRLAWDHTLTSDVIADEWLRMTFSNEPGFIEPAKSMMLASREAVVNYMTPLGLHHIMALNHHYGPGPWVTAERPDWSSPYYHKADARGIGFDRTAKGSNAVSQYHTAVARVFADIRTCPETLLLWFHHVPWNHKMRSGRTLWEELCVKYQEGVDAVRAMQETWASLSGIIDTARFNHVKALLRIQEKEAVWWRDACVLYFQSFSGMPVPPGYEKPAKTLEEYRQIIHYFVPGIENPFITGDMAQQESNL